MKTPKLTILALLLAGAFPARAADDSTEVQALKARVAEIEKALKAAPPGMTPEQEQEFNRIKIKAEALEDSRDAMGLRNLKFSGYMDPAFIWNRNKERATFQFGVPISKEPYSYDNSYFGAVALDVVKETDSGTKFHLTLIPQRAAGDVTGERTILHEASVWIPLGGNDVKLFAGQVPDWSGYEYLSPVANKLITHNLLFDFSLPATYTGAGLELILGKLDLKLMLANMNQSVRNLGESAPMFVFRGDYTGGEFWGLGFAGAEGYKQNLRALDPVNGGPGFNPVTSDLTTDPNAPVYDFYSTKDTRYESIEVDGWYTRGDLTLSAHVAFGQQQDAAITADPSTGKLRVAQWYGASVLVAYKLDPRVEVTLRGDYLDNHKNGGGMLDYVAADPVNGFGPDPAGDPEKGANRYAGTLGLSYALNANVTLKAEGRYDAATKKVFGNKDVLRGGANPKYTKDNVLVGTSAVFYF